MCHLGSGFRDVGGKRLPEGLGLRAFFRVWGLGFRV